MDKEKDLLTGETITFELKELILLIKHLDYFNINTLSIQQDTNGKYVCRVDFPTVEANCIMPKQKKDWILSQLENGWRFAFGIRFCNELQKAILDSNAEDFLITQIKEKFGSLRVYSIGATEEIKKVIKKYEKLSQKTCVNCGAPATRITTNWIMPYCDNCVPCVGDISRHIKAPTISIDEYFKEVENE